MRPEAIILDVDGTLAETEEIHRQAFNETFAEHGLPWHWTQDDYRALLKVAGGRERIRHFLNGAGVSPATIGDAQVNALHAFKTTRYVALLSSATFELRPGIRQLIADARAHGCRLAIATTTSRANVICLLKGAFGPDALSLFASVVCGEDVLAKKPAPEVYLRVLQQLEAAPSACVAIEDSRNGLLAARAAGLRVAITPAFYTHHEDFSEADWVCDAGGPRIAAFADESCDASPTD